MVPLPMATGRAEADEMQGPRGCGELGTEEAGGHRAPWRKEVSCGPCWGPSPNHTPPGEPLSCEMGASRVGASHPRGRGAHMGTMRG